MANTPSLQTLTTMSSLLKNKYLPNMEKALNLETILLNRLKRRPGIITGNRYEFPLQKYGGYGVGPRPETASDATYPVYLPAPGHQSYDRGYLSRKHYYARFKVTGAALSAAAGDGAMVDLLGGEMRGAKDDLAKQVNRDLYGHTSGDGRICTCGTTSNAQTVVVDSTAHLSVGQQVVIAATATGVMVANGNVTVATIASATTFTITSTNITTSSSHAVYPGGTYTGSGGTTSAAYGNSIPGFELILNSTADYAGVTSRSTTGAWFTGTREDGSSGFDIDMMVKVQNAMRTKANGKLTLIVCGESAWRQYGALHVPNHQWLPLVRKIDGGFDSLSFNGVPIVWDPDCPPSSMYFLDESTWAIVEEERLNFIDRDGAILTRVGSGTTAEDAYEATLVWRFNLMCNNPAKNSVIYNIPA